MPKVRQQLKPRSLVKSHRLIANNLRNRIRSKTTPEIKSIHELLGMLNEEMQGVRTSIHNNEAHSNIQKHLENLGVLVLMGITSLNDNVMDW